MGRRLCQQIPTAQAGGPELHPQSTLIKARPREAKAGGALKLSLSNQQLLPTERPCLKKPGWTAPDKQHPRLTSDSKYTSTHASSHTHARTHTQIYSFSSCSGPPEEVSTRAHCEHAAASAGDGSLCLSTEKQAAAFANCPGWTAQSFLLGC